MVSLMLGTNANPNGGIKLLRDSTALGVTTGQYGSAVGTFWSSDDYGGGGLSSEAPGDSVSITPFNFTFLDTGISTTSATTYKFATDSYTQLYLNRPKSGASLGFGRSTITLMEIAG